MIEEWKRIKDYEDYEISNFGRIKSYKQDKNGKITLGNKDKKGYLTKTLYNKDGCKTFKVHRLVAQAFIPNPNNLPQINHKDENKTNNNVKNLEWCTNKYNLNYGTRNKRAAKTMGKKVVCVATGEIFNGIREASRKYNIDRSDISKCCQEKRKTAGI